MIKKIYTPVRLFSVICAWVGLCWLEWYFEMPYLNIEHGLKLFVIGVVFGPPLMALLDRLENLTTKGEY